MNYYDLDSYSIVVCLLVGEYMIPEFNINLLIPSDWQRFETITLEALKIIYNNPNFTKHGRPGQKQDGVDIYLQNNSEVIAAQCKLTFNVIDERMVREEVEKAIKFTPRISILYICTTSPKDARMQEIVRCISLEKGIQCYILFWDDIMQHIKLKQEVFNMLFLGSVYADSKEMSDIAVLNRLLSSVDINSVQKTLEDQLPEYIAPEFAIYFEMFDECYKSITTSFYNNELDAVVRRFFECWVSLTSMTYTEFQPLNGGLIYGFYKDYDTFNFAEYEEKVKIINQLKIDMCKSLFEMISYIKNRYPSVDLDELSLNAVRTRQRVAQYIKNLST